MKNRFLPLSLITAFLGLSLFLFPLMSMAGQPGNPDLRKADGSWLESLRANQNTGIVNPQDVINARHQAEALRFKSTSGAMALNWLPLGPDNFPGMVWSSIFDNTDPAGLTIISGSASGGMWKSINLGLTWTQMPVENNSALTVSSIVQASDGAIYAATGVTTCKTVNFEGSGIYRSTGNGAFAPIPSTVGNPDFKGVAKLAINTASGRLFAATVGGIYFSDNGNDWIKAISGYAMDITVGSDGTVLMAVGDSAYIAPSNDLNARVTLTTDKPNMLPKSGIGWMVFAIAPSDPNVMYASLSGTNQKLLNVYVSSDKGLNWSVIFPNNTSFEPFGGGYGCSSNTIGVFPNDPYKIFLGGFNMWYGERILASGYYNWTQISFGSFGQLSAYFVPSYHHCYMFRPNNPNQFVISSDGGVTIGTIGAIGVTFQTSNKNMQSSQINSIAFSSQKSYVMGGGDRIGTQVLGYFSPSQVSFQTNGYQAWRIDVSSLGTDFQPQPYSYGGNGGSCVWSSVDSRVAVYTRKSVTKIRRQDFTDINYYNLFAMGIRSDSVGNVPMALWESFKQGNAFGITRDSVKFHAEQKAVPADTTVMIRSNSNNILFPYHTTQAIPKGDSITVADPIASRFFIYGDSTFAQPAPAYNVKGIFMTKDMVKFKNDPEYYLIFRNLVNDDPVTALTISSDINTLWAGTQKGRLIRITGIKNAYDSATANIRSSQCVLTDTVYATTPFLGRTVTSISMSPGNPNQVLVTLGNYGNQSYVYYSQNGSGSSPTFTSIQSDLPKAPVFSGLIEMTGNNNAVLGTDLGLYTTNNLNSGTPTWSPDMQNIGDVPVTDVRQQVMDDYHILNRGVIYIGTYGRGMWIDTTHYSPVGVEPIHRDAIANGMLKVSPNPVKDMLYVSFGNETAGDLTLSVYDMRGQLMLVNDLGYHSKGIFNTSVNLSNLSQGTYVVRIGDATSKIVKL